MKAAIIGLPQSGKSTVFSALTGTASDPYAPPEPRLAVVHVPEPRLPYLVNLYQPKKVIETTAEFIDVPGCSLDDSKGQEEWRRVLPVVRQADLLLVVLRDFELSGTSKPDPKAEFAAMWNELIFADLDTVTTRIERIEAALKKPTKTHDEEKRELALLVRCREALESEAPLSTVLDTEEGKKQLRSFAFLTEKPVVCVRNVADDKVRSEVDLQLDHVEDSVVLCAEIEAEIAQLDPADRPSFLADYGLESPASDRLIKTCYRCGGLICFITVGPDEVRAWEIAAGSTAVEAAGKIHTDLARGFIRAETVAYDDFVANTDMKGAKAAGKVRKEGKTYIVQDGDLLNILSSA